MIRPFLLLVMCLLMLPAVLCSAESQTKIEPAPTDTQTTKQETKDQAKDPQTTIIDEGELLEDDLKYLNQGF